MARPPRRLGRIYKAGTGLSKSLSRRSPVAVLRGQAPAEGIPNDNEASPPAEGIPNDGEASPPAGPATTTPPANNKFTDDSVNMVYISEEGRLASVTPVEVEAHAEGIPITESSLPTTPATTTTPTPAANNSSTDDSINVAIGTTQPISYNNRPIKLDSIMTEPLNTVDAFKYKASGDVRSEVAKRKARSRASNSIVNAIMNCADTVIDRTAALAAALAHPDIQEITRKVGMPDPASTQMMKDVLNQQRRIIVRATDKDNSRGRCGDQKRSFIESVFVSMAASPDQIPENRKRTLIDAMGIPKTTY